MSFRKSGFCLNPRGRFALPDMDKYLDGCDAPLVTHLPSVDARSRARREATSVKSEWIGAYHGGGATVLRLADGATTSVSISATKDASAADKEP